MFFGWTLPSHVQRVLRGWLRKTQATGLTPHNPQLSFALSSEERAALEQVFDAAFYLDRNPDVAAAGINPLVHYLSEGWREGRDPSPSFSTRWYMALAPDVTEPGLLHWLHHGQAAGLVPHPPEQNFGLPPASLVALVRAFDAAFYLDRNPDVAAAGMDPLVHYLSEGWREGRDPSPSFSTRWY
ncbi:MAG: hypothetical protein RIQ75_1024, partial [Pseudomonadota bacterium]